MNIRRFKARNNSEALAMIKSALGEEAVILSSRATADGGIEVTAAADLDAARPEAAPRDDAAPAAGYGFADLVARKRRTVPSPAPADEVAVYRRRVIDAIQLAPLRPERHSPMVIALVGPTGAGKTTTCAKIAAHFAVRRGLDVALLSTDCYRIGATEQLRTYGRIMKIPCEVVIRPEKVSRAIDAHRRRDLVIIDTTGRSPYDRGGLDELGRWLADERIMPILTLPATTKKEDLAATAEAYGVLGPRGVALTKLDETRAYAVICRYLAGAHLPVSCLGIGQRVPEDFHPGSRDFLRALFEQGLETARGLAPQAMPRTAGATT